MLFYKTYEKNPSKEWVVFIHGLGGSHSIFYKQVKEYKKHFNLLFIDLRGHGGSKNLSGTFKSYTFDMISKEVIEVLLFLNIQKAHFIGISLGSLIISNISRLSPHLVKSLILGGTITRFNPQSKLLIELGDIGRTFLPFMWLYKLFAWILMPRKSHALSRNAFISEAKKLNRAEFVRWFQLSKQVEALYAFLKKHPIHTPVLYLMGEQDYMFLPQVKADVAQEPASKLHIIKQSGHVCNIDQPAEFNEVSITFIQKISRDHSLLSNS